MRQIFDVGDLVSIANPVKKTGIILDKKLININTQERDPANAWHPDEYKCKIRILDSSDIMWVRAHWLEHLSKIKQ